jgi:hypothetical protein
MDPKDGHETLVRSASGGQSPMVEPAEEATGGRGWLEGQPCEEAGDASRRWIRMEVLES